MNLRVDVLVKLLPSGLGLPLPAYQSEGSAGFDLIAAIPDNTSLVIEPHAHELIPTGLAIAVPSGFEAQIRPRSGLALRHGVTVLNSPGTIDSDYRGEVGVILINHGTEPFVVTRGLRIAQMVLAPVARAALIETNELDQTLRGIGGFGSTGLSESGGRTTT